MTYETSLIVPAARGDYLVERAADAIGWINADEHSIVVADKFFEDQVDNPNSIFIEAVEERKTLETVGEICEELAVRRVPRNGHLVALGGGIVQDVSTLVASLYMRGISWSYVPTTLLGMVDSAVGGKSSINVGASKNLVGNIYPPDKILIDIGLCRSLARVDVLCGLSEALKILYCGGSNRLGEFLDRQLDVPSADLDELVWHSLETKVEFLRVDEFDQAERRLLNFGHTFGHALETGSNYKIPHGIAVAYGMWMAFRWSVMQGLPLDSSALSQWIQSIDGELAGSDVSNIEVDLLACRSGFERDKKHSNTHFRLIVPTGETVQIIEVERTSSSLDQIMAVMQSIVTESQFLEGV